MTLFLIVLINIMIIYHLSCLNYTKFSLKPILLNDTLNEPANDMLNSQRHLDISIFFVVFVCVCVCVRATKEGVLNDRIDFS